MMKEKASQNYTRLDRLNLRAAHDVLAFSLVTVALTFAVALLPLPMLVTPILAVLIPALVAVGLVILTGGIKQVPTELFRPDQWRFSLKWLLIPFGLILAQWLLVFVLAYVLGIPARFGIPVISPLHLAVFFFAAGEEIGWRGYALPRLLKSYPPLAASLLLGIPWAGLHYALMLPGEMLAGTPPLAHSLTLLSLSVLLTWAYLTSNRSLLAVIFLHGWFNAPSLLVMEDAVALKWLVAVVVAGLAILILIVTKGIPR